MVGVDIWYVYKRNIMYSYISCLCHTTGFREDTLNKTLVFKSTYAGKQQFLIFISWVKLYCLEHHGFHFQPEIRVVTSGLIKIGCYVHTGAWHNWRMELSPPQWLLDAIKGIILELNPEEFFITIERMTHRQAWCTVFHHLTLRVMNYYLGTWTRNCIYSS